MSASIPSPLHESGPAPPESEFAFRDLVEESNDLIQSVAPDGRFVYVNRVWRETLGYSEEQVKVLHLLDIIHPDSQEHCMEVFKRVIGGEKVERFEAGFLTNDGREIIVEGSANCLFREGQPVATRGIFRNITERKRAEEELNREKTFIDAALNALPDVFHSFDLEGKSLKWNRAVSKVTGYTDEEISSMTPFDYISKEDEQRLADAMAATLEAGSELPFEADIVTKDGRRIPFDFGGTLLRDSEGKAIGFAAVGRSITERKRAEETLRESEEKYRKLLENLAEGIWMIDQDSRTTFVNDRMAEMLGCTPEEMMGRSLFAFMDEEGVKLAKRGVERRKSGIKEQHDFEFLRKDGTRFYATLETSPITDDKGNYAGALAGVIDITERKLAERALRESEEKYRGLYDSIRDGIVMVDMDGNILDCNRAYLEMLGYTMDEARRLTYQELTPEKWHEVDDGIVESQISKLGYSEPYEKEYIRKDGTVFPIAVRSWQVTDEHGKPVGMWGIVRDMTKRKEMEEAVRKEQEFTTNLFDSLKDVVYVMSAEGAKMLRWNEALEDVTGYTDEEIGGMTVLDFFEGEDLQRQADFYQALLEKGQAGIDATAVTKDGRRIPYDFFSTLVKDADGTPMYVFGVGRDITDRRRAEEALERESAVNNALAGLTGEMLSPVFSIGEIADMVLDNAKQLTGSQFGFVGYIDPKTGNFISSTMTRDVWDKCRVADKSVVFEKFGGLWGWVLNNRKPIVTNSPSEDPRSTGVPEGHIPIRRFLSAPAVIGDVLVGQIALANSERDYTDEDLAVVERLALLFAIATQRKRMEDAIRDAEAKYRELAETLPQVVFELNMEGVITYVNNAAYELFGYGPEDLERGMSALEVIAGEDRETVAGTIYKMMTGQSSGDTGEYLAKRKDGSTFPAIVYTTLVTDQEGRPAWMRGILTDITDRKRAEEELQRVNAELEGFAHTVSHDLKGPLTVIALSDDTLLELLRAPMTDETKSDMEETTRMIQEGVVRATSLIDELLLLAKSGQVPEVVSDVNVGEVVKNILNEKARIINERGVKVEVGEDLGQIRANRTHMYQVFSNLIGNALTYNDSEHPVISVSCLGDDETGAHRYLMRDNGSGIPPDQLEKLFLPFFKGESGSTGIGLSIVERIVHLYEGQIVAYNDKGACFKFTLKDFPS